MNKPKLASLFITLSLLLSTGCAGLKKGEKSLASAIKLEVKKEKDIDIKAVRDKIIEDRQRAIASGPEQVQFTSTDLFFKANDASVRGDSKLAAFLFGEMVQLNPRDLYLKKRLAIELIRIGEIEKAKPMLELVFEGDKKEQETIGLVLGGIYTALEDKPSAQKMYQTLLKINPKNEEACIFLAKSYGIDKKYKKAFSLLTSCEKRIPNKGIFSYYKGKISILRNQKKKALSYFRKSLKSEPNYHQSVLGIGILHEESEHFDKAIKLYKDFLKSDPMNYPILSRVVQLMFKMQSYDGIIGYAERLSTLDPDDLNLKVRLGILYSDKKRLADAKGVFQEILSVVPESDKILYYLGSLYQQTEEYEKAIQYFNRVSSGSALFHDSHLQIAQILQRLALINETNQKRFVRFVKEKSTSFEGLRVELNIVLATYWEGLSNINEAIRTVESLQSEKGYDRNHDYYLASLYEKVKRFDKARDVIGRVLKENPKDPHALNFLGYSLLESGKDLDLAYQYILQAVSLRPDDGYIRDSLGWYYYKTGQLDKALKETKKAWGSVKTDVVITRHLAEIYSGLKQYKQAEKYLEEALRLCKYDSEREDVLQAMRVLKSKRLPASKE